MGKFFSYILPKLFVFTALVLAVWIGHVTMKEMDRGKRIQEEIASLHAEAQKTQKENNVLKEKIRYFQTDAFQEQEARNKLNYQGENERAVVIKSPVPVREESINAPSIDIQRQNLLPNYQKWWNQFFASSPA